MHQETLNQDWTFKQTNELWITPLSKLPAQSVLDGKIWRIEKEKRVRKHGKTFENKRGADGESNREEDTEKGGAA